MSTNTDETRSMDEKAIRGILETIRKAHHERDAAAIAALYARDALIYDLAPPLARRGVDPAELEKWFETWDGPIEHETRDFEIAIEGDRAFCHGLVHIRASTRSTREPAAWWMRVTSCLRRVEGKWKIVHEHTSVPFYMDGSFRAALDLRP